MQLLERNSWILWVLLSLCLALSSGGGGAGGSSAVYFLPSESNLSDLSFKENLPFAKDETYTKFKSHPEEKLGEMRPKWKLLKEWRRKSFVQAEIWIDNSLLYIEDDEYLDLTYTHMYRLSAKFEGSRIPKISLLSHHFIFLTDSIGKEGIRIDFDPREERKWKGNPLIEISRHENINETILSWNEEPFQVPITLRFVADLLFHASYPKYGLFQSLPCCTKNSGNANCQTFSEQLELKIKSSVKYMALTIDGAKVKCRNCKEDLEAKTYSYSRRDVKCDSCKRSCIKMECHIFHCSKCIYDECTYCTSGEIQENYSEQKEERHSGCNSCKKKKNRIKIQNKSSVTY